MGYHEIAARFGCVLGAIAMVSEEEVRAKQEREAKRAREPKDIPLQEIDESKWPKGVRQIAMKETGGLEIDRDGRLYWNGKPVEIVGRRLDLTRSQNIVAVVIAVATVIGAVAACVQGALAYHDWACKVNWPAWVACPPKPPSPSAGDFPG